MANTDSSFALLRDLKVGDFYKTRELPTDVATALNDLVEAFARADSQQKDYITKSVNTRFSFAFFMYAGRMAVQSVREGKPDLLNSGLLALAIENLAFDYRDTLYVLVKIYNSARKFPGIDPDELFEKVADMCCDPFGKALLNFAHGSEDAKSLKSFGLKESAPPAPFGYESTGGESKKRPRLRRFLSALRRRIPVLK